MEVGSVREDGAFRDDALVDESPECDQQPACERDDADAAQPRVVIEFLAVPLRQRAIGLKSEPAPRELNGECPDLLLPLLPMP